MFVVGTYGSCYAFQSLEYERRRIVNLLTFMLRSLKAERCDFGGKNRSAAGTLSKQGFLPCPSYTWNSHRDANLWRSKIWRFFPFGLPTPPPSINLPTPPPFLFPPPPKRIHPFPQQLLQNTRIFCHHCEFAGKTGYLCQEFLLVNWRSNQTIGYMAMIAKGSHFV